MKTVRKVIFWCHLCAGVIAGIIILIMSITGLLLTYEKQITYWADTRSYSVKPPSEIAARLPFETLLAKMRENQPALPSIVTVRSVVSAPAAIVYGRDRTIYVNPYTGEVLGEGSQRVRSFFHVVTDWHRWLGASGDNRSIARAVTGACNLIFLFIVISGFYMWWPRRWTWGSIRNVIWFKRGLPGKARDFNWHNVIGFWCAIPLLIVVLSATVISYQWASNLVYRLAGETPPAPRGVGGQSTAAPQRSEVSPFNSFSDLDSLWARAEQQVPGWQSISLRLPASANAPALFTIDLGNPGEPHKRAQLTLDRTGKIISWEPFSNYSAGRRIRSILRFAHTGEVAGMAGQTIAGIASAGGTMLVLTGLALALRRFRASLAERSRRPIMAATRIGSEITEQTE
jgi:uncharacterized iron-regulated membrane protein